LTCDYANSLNDFLFYDELNLL